MANTSCVGADYLVDDLWKLIFDHLDQIKCRPRILLTCRAWHEMGTRLLKLPAYHNGWEYLAEQFEPCRIHEKYGLGASLLHVEFLGRSNTKNCVEILNAHAEKRRLERSGMLAGNGLFTRLRWFDGDDGLTAANLSTGEMIDKAREDGLCLQYL